VLAPKTRAAIRIAALLYIGLGLVLFAAPEWSASAFPWTVSPFVAMTMGGWALGNGIGAWLASTRGPAARVLPLLGYLALFAGAQLLVVIAFRSVLQLDVLLAVPYLLTLGFTLIAASFGILELRTTQAIVVEEDVPISRNVRLLLIALTLFLLALAVGGFLAGPGGLSTTGKIFPEPLTLFTVRAFAAFYLALAAATGALVLRPMLASTIIVGLFGISLILPITAAAFLHTSAFDFAGRPLGIVYIAAYLVVFFPALGFLWTHRADMPTV
jgi:hypothetical protein